MTKKYADPIRLLIQAHRRTERFLYLLITLQRQAHGGALSDGQCEAMDCALRYFREVTPRHCKDEEESLFPRIRQSEKLPSIQRLCEDHRLVEEDHRLLQALGQRWLFDGSLSEGESLLFGNVLSRISRITLKHMHQEETQIFPAAQELNDADISMIGKEMAARR